MGVNPVPKPRSKPKEPNPNPVFSEPPVEVEREPTPQEVLASILKELNNAEQLLVLKGEVLSSGRVNIPTVYSGRARIIEIAVRDFEKQYEKSEAILVVVVPQSEKVLVNYNYKFYVYWGGKWEMLE